MACFDQLLWIIQYVGGPIIVAGVIVTLLGWLGLFPIFRCTGYSIHQYPYFGRQRRTVHAKVQMRLGFRSTSIQASLRLVKNGVTLLERHWLAWQETRNPDSVTIAPFQSAIVRVLSVDENDKKTGVPLAGGEGVIGFSPIPDGEYDVQLWIRCPFWGRNEGKKLLSSWHWNVPQDIISADYEPHSMS